MKKIFFALIIAYCLPANAQWTDIKFTYLIHSFRDVYFINQDTGWVAGNMVYKTNDGGVTWHQQLPYSGNPPYMMINSVFFINNNIGWAVGKYNTQIKTTDGGNTWSKLQIPDSCYFWDVCFVNPDTGWVLGTVYNPPIGRIYHTIDGGDTWIIQKDSGGTSISMINDSVGWVAWGSMYMFHTNNGGNTWTTQNFGGLKCNFIDSLFGWGTYYTSLFSTQDGGQTWTDKYDDPLFRDMHSVFFINRDTGWAVGYDVMADGYGFIIGTVDGGDNWTEQAYSDSLTLCEIQFVNENVGYAVDDYNVLKTVNGGCCGISAVIPATLIVGVSSEENNQRKNVRVWPNPLKNEININFNSEENSQIKIDLFDCSMRYLYTLKNEACIKKNKRFSFTLDFLPPGMYYILITENVSGNRYINNYKIIKL